MATSARDQRTGAASAGSSRLLTAVSDALEAHSAALVTDTLCRKCGLTPTQAGPGLQEHLSTLYTQPPNAQQLRVFHALRPFAKQSFYTGSPSKIALPTVPGSSSTAVKAVMQQLTCGHPANRPTQLPSRSCFR